MSMHPNMICVGQFGILKKRSSLACMWEVVLFEMLMQCVIGFLFNV